MALVPHLPKPPRSAHKGHEDEHEEELHAEEVWLVSYADLMTLLFGLFVILYSMSSVDTKKYEAFSKAAVESFGGEYQLPTESLKRELDKGLKEAGISKDDVKVEQGLDGLELSFKGQTFFQSGSSDPTAEAQKFLARTKEALVKTGDDYTIRVEGHTDSQPINTERYPSNWELSSARATSVVRFLETQGINPSKMEAIGFGSSRPIAREKDETGNVSVDGMAKNRRIVIKVRRLDPKEIEDIKKFSDARAYAPTLVPQEPQAGAPAEGHAAAPTATPVQAADAQAVTTAPVAPLTTPATVPAARPQAAPRSPASLAAPAAPAPKLPGKPKTAPKRSSDDEF
jgi:chemotaxis protein MotB